MTTNPSPLKAPALWRMVVTTGHEETAGPYLAVDCSAIAANDNQPHYWHLYPEDDGTWTHGPSGTNGHLGEVLAAIAACYEPR